MNSIVLMGRLTHSPDLRTSRAGKEYCRFSIAVRRDKEKTDYFECAAFGSTGKFISDYFVKGQMICVKGEMHIDQKKDEQSGKTMKYPSVFVDDANFCGDGKGKAPDTSATAAGAYSAPQATAAPDDFSNVEMDDELPF